MTKEFLKRIDDREQLLLKRLNFHKLPFGVFMQDLYSMWLCATVEDSDDIFIANFDKLLKELKRLDNAR